MGVRRTFRETCGNFVCLNHEKWIQNVADVMRWYFVTFCLKDARIEGNTFSRRVGIGMKAYKDKRFADVPV